MTSLIRGREKGPLAMLVYGVPGVGKSTFASGANNPVFLGPERNQDLQATKFPRNKTHAELMGYLKEIEQGKHDKDNFRTVVLDSIDMHQNIIHADICATEPGKTMETARKGYGKAYKEAAKMLFELRDQIELIMNKKEMDIIILGHSIKIDFNDPMIGTNYDRYEMCLHKGKKFDHNSIFVDWASSVLFLNWKIYATEDGNHAVSIGKREILTEYRPSHLAKNRYNLPYSIEMLDDAQKVQQGLTPETFKVVQGHIDQFYASGADANTFQNDFNILIHECKNLFAEVNDENVKPQIEGAINGFLTSAITDPTETLKNLTVVRDRINEIVSNQ